MLSYCLKCRKNIGSKNPRSCKNKKWKKNALPNCVVCNKIFTEQEPSELLSFLIIKISLSKII